VPTNEDTATLLLRLGPTPFRTPTLCKLVGRLYAKRETLPESLCVAFSLRETLCELVEHPHAKGETLPESLCVALSLREAL
jgi:hypothetical protein